MVLRVMAVFLGRTSEVIGRHDRIRASKNLYVIGFSESDWWGI